MLIKIKTTDYIMTTLILSNNSASLQEIENATFIQAASLRDTLIIALDEYKSSDIIIESSSSAYSNAKLACEYKIKFFHEGTTHTTSTKKPFEKALFLFEIAEKASDCIYAEEYLIKRLMYVVPSDLREEQALELIKQACNNEHKSNALNNFKKAIKSEKDAVRATITISNSNKDVTYKNVGYGDELANHIINLHNSDENTLNIFTGFLAAGKTTTLVKVFNKLCEQKCNPIALGCSRALMSSLLPKNDKRFDREAMKTNEMQNGLLGVANTILMTERFTKERLASQALLIEEIEESLNHFSGEAVGQGKLNDMIHIYTRFEEQFKQSKTVVVTEALLSEFTLSYLIKLAKKSGKKVFVYTQESAKKKSIVKVMTEEMNITAARQNLKDDKKIAVFCDGSHNKTRSSFNALYNTINPTCGFSVRIDASFMQSEITSKRIANVDGLADDMVAIFYNTAAKCGLSIQNGQYTNTHVFANYTAAPNEIIQAAGRFRDTQNIFLSFSRMQHKLAAQTKWSILSSIMHKECTPEDFTKEKQDNLFENEMVKTVLARIEYKNKMKKNYKNKVLMMHEILGYEIEYVVKDEVKSSLGGANKKRGSKIEKTLRTNGVIAAVKINQDEAKARRKCGDFNSQSKKNELESFDLRSFYKAADVNEELMNFDNAAKGRKAITNMMIARQTISCKTIEQQIKQKMIAKFFETTGLDPLTFGRYNSTAAKRFSYFLSTGSIKVGELIMNAKDAFFIAFPDSIISKPTDTVRSILIKSFMLNKDLITKTDRTGGDWNYLASNNLEVEARYSAINLVVKIAVEIEKIVVKRTAKPSSKAVQNAKGSIKADTNDFKVINDLIEISEKMVA
jgi:hypothetical protein